MSAVKRKCLACRLKIFITVGITGQHRCLVADLFRDIGAIGGQIAFGDHLGSQGQAVRAMAGANRVNLALKSLQVEILAGRPRVIDLTAILDFLETAATAAPTDLFPSFAGRKPTLACFHFMQILLRPAGSNPFLLDTHA